MWEPLNRKKTFYKLASSDKYFHVSGESYFDNAILKHLLTDIVFNHTAVYGYTQSFNYKYANKNFDRPELDSKRLADAFFGQQLCRFYEENSSEQLFSRHFLISY